MEQNELRKRAEEAFAKHGNNGPELSNLEIQHLVHELQVHQIELEMQNEELRRAHHEIESSRDQYADLYDFAPMGYATVGKTGLIEETNLTCAALLGVDRGVLIGQRFAHFVAEEYQDNFYLYRRRVSKTRERESCDVEMVRDDGTVFYAHLEGIAVGESEGVASSYRIAINDISELKQLEAEFVRLERLHAKGEISAGISHNLNNMLTGILGPAQFLRSRVQNPENVEDIEIIFSAATRIKDLVHRLHLSTQGSRGKELEPVDVKRNIEEAVRDARPRWQDEADAAGISIQIVTDLLDVPEIKGSESELNDILTNLLLNAIDAMPQGGKITIATQLYKADVLLVFSDTGIGMDEAVRERVFESFFTTKLDVGTGLGLSTVYATIERWGGSIDVEREPHKGTTFTLRLPIWTASGIAGFGA